MSTDQPATVDLLGAAIARTAKYLDRSISVVGRVRSLWAAVATASVINAAADDVLEDEFIKLARQTGLTADLGAHGAGDVRHIVRWGLVDRNPFC